MTGENDTRKKYPIGSAEGRAEADRRIAEANNTVAQLNWTSAVSAL